MEKDFGAPLSRLPHLDDGLRARLRELNVTTAEEVVALAAVRGGSGGMARFLDIPEEELTARVAAIRDSLSARSVAAMEQPYATPLGLGALRPPATARSAAPGPFERAQTAALPAAVNMIARLRPVQNQGQRGTCVSFACTALNEDFEGRWLTEPGGAPDLSEQCLYRRCKEHDGEPQAEGTRVAVAMGCLVRYGQATEACEAYNPNPPTNQPGPHGARCAAESPQHKLSGLLCLHERSVPDIKGALADDRLVAFSIPVYASWYESAAVAQTGCLTMPLPGEQPEGGHALLFVGYQDDTTTPGGGYFVFRNSWSAAWAPHCAYKAGYGTLPYKYMADDGWEAYTYAHPGDGDHPGDPAAPTL